MHEVGSSPQSIIDSIQMGWLPSPPHVFSRLLDICRDPHSSATQLAEIISTDAVLTGKLFMAFNSAAYAIHQPFNNIAQVVSLLDQQAVKNMVLTLSIQQLFAGLINSRKKVVCDDWVDSLYCAMFARGIAEALDYEHPQDAYLAGLLHDYGQTVFDAKFHDQYVDMLDSETEEFIVDREISKFGVGHTELGANIIEQWSCVSPAVADAVRFHHEEYLEGSDLLCQIVAEASMLAWQWSRHGRADAKWRSSLIDDKVVKDLYTRVRHEVLETAARVGVPVAKSASLKQDHVSSDMDRVTIRLGRKIRDASLIGVINSRPTEAKPIASPADLLLKIAREMQLVFSISNVALLFPGADQRDELILYELSHRRPLSRFAVENNNSKAIQCFLDGSEAWIDADKTGAEPVPITDRQIIRRLNSDVAVCLPLTHENRIIGAVIIGSNQVQRNYLSNQTEFISAYLRNMAETWLKNEQDRVQQALDRDIRIEQEQRGINKLLHEISNPLSVIGNYIEIMKANAVSEEVNNDRELTILKEELERVDNMVLKYKDAKNTQSTAVFLNDELQICVPLYIRSIDDEKAVRMIWQLDEQDSKINISRDAFRQILLNLVKNAVEAQAGDAEITISSHHYVNFDGAAFAQFTIADRGKGVDPATRQQLFSPLNSAKMGKGRGLGLSVVADTLKTFHGKIKYLENEFGGATFEVAIPLSLEKLPDN